METELITSQLTAAYVMSSLIEWLKCKPWFPFITPDNAKLNRAFSMVVAFLTGIGVHFSFDADTGVLMITGLTAAGILHTSWAAIQQAAMQQFFYSSVVRPQTEKKAESKEPDLVVMK